MNEKAALTTAPLVPPPITRTSSVVFQVYLDAGYKTMELAPGVFNGRVGSLTGANALQVKTGERVRIYFGNAGPNLDSSFHVVGTIFDKLYREGDLISPPARGVGVTLVPAAGAAVMEITFEVPGRYTMMDHSIFRTEKGALGVINVTGPPRPDLYQAIK